MKKITLITMFMVFAFAINLSAQTWTVQTSGVTSILRSVSVVDANVAFISGDAGQILKTTNGGINWTNIAAAPIPTTFGADVVRAIDANTIIVAGSPADTYIYKTTNGGTNWTQVFTQVGGYIDDIQFKDATNGFAYGDPVGARWSLWKTTNAGTTWDSTGLYLPQVSTEAGWDNAMCLRGNNIWFGTNAAHIYRSTNYGTSWISTTTTGLTQSTGITVSGNIGFVTSGSASLKSTDAGATWSAFTAPGTGSNVHFQSLGTRFWIAQTDIFYSTDNGTTFPSSYTYGTQTTGPIWNIGANITGYQLTVYATGYAGGIWKYTETLPSPVPTGTWTEQTSGVTTALQSVSAVDDNVAWTCGASGKVLRTTNQGVTWTNVTGTIPTTITNYCIFAWDANTAIVTGVAGSNTSIYQTSDGGANWTLANTHAGFGDDIYMTSASNAYFIGDPVSGAWDLLKSTNTGLNWSSWATITTTNTSGTYNNAACLYGQQVWFSPVGDANFQYSSNMGANWSTQTITLSEIAATWFNSSTLGIAGGSGTSPGLLITTNSGTNWTTLAQTFVGSTTIAGITGAQTSWWVAKQDTTIYFSSNNGTNWALQYAAPNYSTKGVFYHMTKSRAGATIWGVRSLGGISRYGLPITGVTPITNEVPSTYSLSQNYPNPFNPVTKISFNIPKSGLVTLKVYDVIGKEVATLVNDVKNPGNYAVNFNASALSSGVYFYKLESNEFTSVKKMMLIK